MQKELPAEQLQNKISRREAIKRAGVLLLGGTLDLGLTGIIRTGVEWWAQRNSWSNTANQEKYLKENERRLSQISLGCSFAPERLEGLNLSLKNQDPAKMAIAQEGLAFLIDELGMKEIRLGIRWNNVIYQESNGQEHFDFSFYEPFIQTCLDRGVNICLNIGPIKTFGWPEEQLPRGLKIPEDTAEIHSSDPLGEKALQYFDQLLKYLKEKYPGQEHRFTQIQPENEAFNRFGEHPWKMSNEYLLKVIDKVHTAFPNAGILLNAPGTTTNGNPLYPGIVEMSDFIQGNNAQFGGKLQLGYNYYHYVPGYPELFGQIFDSNAFVDVSSGVDKLGELNVAEITEMQAEPWSQFTAPGNDSHEFLNDIDRSLQALPQNKLPNDKKRAVRAWGAERWIMLRANDQLTPEHRRIFGIIKHINTLSLA